MMTGGLEGALAGAGADRIRPSLRGLGPPAKNAGADKTYPITL